MGLGYCTRGREEGPLEREEWMVTMAFSVSTGLSWESKVGVLCAGVMRSWGLGVLVYVVDSSYPGVE